ncbi:MAG: P-loop NTPase [Nanoarchaeota archaeon]
MTKTVLVMSGKGGVGKTTIAVNLSYFLYKKKFDIGLLDVDIHGPNALKMFGYDNISLEMFDEKIIPFNIFDKLKVVSIAGCINDDSAIIWRGPKKHKAIKQLIQNVKWGNLDYLVVDFPPGTGDEHISAIQLLDNICGVVIVSTPQMVSLMDMNRSIDFCNQMNVPILGVIENMSGEIFGSGTVKKKCVENNINFLGNLRLSKKISNSSKICVSFLEENDKKLNKEFEKIVNNIEGVLKNENCNIIK